MSGDDFGIDWAGLDRYLAVEGSLDEREAMRRTIAASPTLAALVEAMRLAAGPAADAERRWDVARAWATVSSRTGLTGGFRALSTGRGDDFRSLRSPVVLSLERHPSNQRARFAWALSGAVAVGGVLALAWLRSSAPAGRPPVRTPPPQVEFSTARGERLHVELTDGTGVMLAPESRLRVLEMEGGVRSVALTGEAVFDVTHDAARPFRVRAAHTVTQDLGTRFAVRAYPGDNAVRIVVVAGRVVLRDATQDKPALAGDDGGGTILTAGQLGLWRAGMGAPTHRQVDPTPYFAWTRGCLVLRRVPLEEAAAQIGRWYGVEVRIDSAAMHRASAMGHKQTLTAHWCQATLIDALGAVDLVFNVRYKRSENLVVFHARP